MWALTAVTDSLFEALRVQNAVVANHPHSHLYQSLRAVCRVDALYLESEPCAICSEPELPFETVGPVEGMFGRGAHRSAGWCAGRNTGEVSEEKGAWERGGTGNGRVREDGEPFKKMGGCPWSSMALTRPAALRTAHAPGYIPHADIREQYDG